MRRNLAVGPLVRRERRNRFTLQASLLPDDQAVEISQKQRMLFTLVDGICPAGFQPGFLRESLRHIVLQVTPLPHGLIVDVLNGIADFVVVDLKCGAIGIHAQNRTGIRSGDAAFAVAKPIFFAQIQCRYKTFHAIFNLSFMYSSAMEKSYSTKSFRIVENSPTKVRLSSSHRAYRKSKIFRCTRRWFQ